MLSSSLMFPLFYLAVKQTLPVWLYIFSTVERPYSYAQVGFTFPSHHSCHCCCCWFTEMKATVMCILNCHWKSAVFYFSSEIQTPAFYIYIDCAPSGPWHIFQALTHLHVPRLFSLTCRCLDVHPICRNLSLTLPKKKNTCVNIFIVRLISADISEVDAAGR